MDCKTHIHIVFEKHGIVQERELYINYFEDEDTGVDQRVIDSFKEMNEQAEIDHLTKLNTGEI